MIFLKLCPSCAPKPQQVEKNGFRWNGYEQWCRLPAFCPECEAKVAQCVRLLALGHGLVEPKPAGALECTRADVEPWSKPER